MTDQKCCICLSSRSSGFGIKSDTKVTMSCSCNTPFHSGCLTPWFVADESNSSKLTHGDCPVCRDAIPKEELEKIFGIVLTECQDNQYALLQELVRWLVRTTYAWDRLEREISMLPTNGTSDSWVPMLEHIAASQGISTFSVENLSTTVQFIKLTLEEIRTLIFQDIDGFSTTVQHLEEFERSHIQHLVDTITDPIWNEMRNVSIANAMATDFRFQQMLKQTDQNQPLTTTVARIWYVHTEIFNTFRDDQIFFENYRAFLTRIKNEENQDTILDFWDAVSK